MSDWCCRRKGSDFGDQGRSALCTALKASTPFPKATSQLLGISCEHTSIIKSSRAGGQSVTTACRALSTMSALLHATQSTSVYLYAASSVLLLGALAFLYHVFDLGGPKIPKGLRAPPSPPGARLFSGHAHIYSGQVTSNPSESQLVKWADELGEIYQIQMGTQRWVVLSSPEAIKVSNSS